MKWTPREIAPQFQRISLYSTVVRYCKFGLIGLAFLLIVMVFIVPMLHEDDNGARLVFTDVEVTEKMEPRMSNPRFQGIDQKGRPYNIIAKSATQQEDSSILLDAIEADITLANGAWLALHSQTGTYVPQKEMLFLRKQVEIFHDAGYDVATEAMDVNLTKSIITGSEPVTAKGEAGNLEARRFKVDIEAGKMWFYEDVKVTLYPRGKTR